MFHCLSTFRPWLGLAGLTLIVAATDSASAQGTRPRPSAAATNLRTLESKTQEARQTYLGQLSDLAKGYEDGGNIEQAQETLRQILKVTPDDEQIKARLKILQDKVFQDHQKVIEVDSTKGWISTGLRVTKGEPIRLQSEGSYKFIVNTDIGPDGFATDDVMRDMAAGANCGALIGTVLPDPARPGRPAQPTKPFQIGREGEIRPEADGVLFVRLNVPPASKCIGKVKLMVSGNIAGVGG